MRRIMLVDDEEIILNVLSSFFRLSDYDVVDVADSARAVEIIRSNEKLDVLVSDIRMDPVNGLELLQISKQARPDMPVILITGFASRETFRQARELGAFDCLSKPFEPDRLLETVEESLKTAKIQPLNRRNP